MAISSPGIGSGLNITSIVSQLVAVEQQPVALLQSKGSTLQTKMSVFGKVKSELAALQDAATALMSATTWTSKNLTSDTSAAVTGTATSSALASSFPVSVTNLASAQSVKTSFSSANPYTPPTTDQTLTIALGTWDSGGTTLTPRTPASSVDITIKPTDTLADIAANINKGSSTSGVNATVVTSGTVQQLLIRGTSTGASAGFKITSSPDASPFSVTSIDETNTKNRMATDANITIDGIAVASATNTVKDAVTGVTLNLLAKTTTDATISVDVDKTAIKAKIQAFQDAYNTLAADLKTQTAYNAATKVGAPLLGDGTTTGLQNMLRTLVGSNGPSTSTIGRLSDMGLEIQADGSLSTNTTKLDAALQDPSNVQKFFSESSGAVTGNGIAKRIYDFAFGALGVGGSVTAHSAAFQKAIDQNNTAIDKFNTHIAAYQKQLLAQYTRLDTNMSTLTSLNTFVTSQVAQWNKSS